MQALLGRVTGAQRGATKVLVMPSLKDHLCGQPAFLFLRLFVHRT